MDSDGEKKPGGKGERVKREEEGAGGALPNLAWASPRLSAAVMLVGRGTRKGK